MTKSILIVSSDPDVYGAYQNAKDYIDRYVYKVIIGGIRQDLIDEIISIIEANDISTIITRGMWFNYFLESEYIQQHPKIHIDQLVVDNRSVFNQLAKITEMGYKKVGIISVHSAQSFDPPENFENYCIGDISFDAFGIYDIANPLNEIVPFLKRTNCELLYGDVADLPLPDMPRVNFRVRSKALIAMIKNAVIYAEALEAEKNRNKFYKFLEAMTNTVSEGILLFDSRGAVIECNLKALKAFSLNKVSGLLIQDLLTISLEALVNMPNNNLLTINKKVYVTNVLKMEIGEVNDVYAIVLNSTQIIENTELTIRTQMVKRGFDAKYKFDDIIAVDPVSKETKDKAFKFSQFDETVLILGETGTGKELYASSIHNNSIRCDKPFVAVNCAAFSESLIESELFGYEKGSFTGALSAGKKGLFELAHKGTIFLDEIGEMPLYLQTKLLRVLQEKCVLRIGGSEIIPVDVRIIAATNKNLSQLSETGTFRRDLYYRLSLLEFKIIPLRDRLGDIIPLFKHFISKNMDLYNRKLYWDSDSIFLDLLDYNWPGNIRELENAAKRSVILAEKLKMTKSDIQRGMQLPDVKNNDNEKLFSIQITNDLDFLEKEYLIFLLKQFHNNKGELCNYLKISKPTLWRKLNYGSDSEPDI